MQKEICFLLCFILAIVHLVIVFFKMNSSVYSLLLLALYMFILSCICLCFHLSNRYTSELTISILHYKALWNVHTCLLLSPSLLVDFLIGLLYLNAIPLPQLKGLKTQCLLPTRILFSFWPKWLWKQQTISETAWRKVNIRKIILINKNISTTKKSALCVR